MSRAFTKEADGDAAVEDFPEIPISPYPNVVTQRGLQMIDDKITELQRDIQTVAGKDRSTSLRLARDLRYWAARRASAEVAPVPADTDEIRFGHQVTLLRNKKRETFRLVGQDEADPAQGLLSYVSPLASALIGASEGESVEAGGGAAEIISIEI